MSDRVIERTVEFEADMDQVWRAITDPGELSKWFGDRTLLTLTPGSDGTMIWDGHGAFAVRVEEVEPPTRFVWSWVHEPDVAFDAAPSTRVEWMLSRRDGGGTILHLRESGFRTDLHFEQNTEGWTEELSELAELVSG